MPELELYQKFNLFDDELPLHIFEQYSPGPDVVVDPHWHEHIEMIYVEQGTADFKIGPNFYHAGPGDFIIANSCEIHGIYCTKGPYKECVIIVDINVLSKEIASKNYVFQRFIQNDFVIKELYEKIFAEKNGQRIGFKPMCRALIMELIVYLCRFYVQEDAPDAESKRRRLALERLTPVLYYIESKLGDRITINELAELICLSEDRFSHLFREALGRSPLQYINEIRLRKAMILLQTQQYNVTKVAEEVGFTDYNHFGRLFMKRYGCTPNQVRLGKVEPKDIK